MITGQPLHFQIKIAIICCLFTEFILESLYLISRVCQFCVNIVTHRSEYEGHHFMLLLMNE